MTSTRLKLLTASPANPHVSKHALKRAHERFGIPIKDSHRWIISKMKKSRLVGVDGQTKLYAVNGVCLRVNHHTIVTVTQLTDEEIKKITRINSARPTIESGKIKREKDRPGQAEMPVLPGPSNPGDE